MIVKQVLLSYFSIDFSELNDQETFGMSFCLTLAPTCNEDFNPKLAPFAS